MKHKLSLILAGVCILAGCVFRFAMPGHDFIGYLLWLLAVLIFAFPRLSKTWRIVLAALLVLGAAVFAVFEAPVISNAKTDAAPQSDYLIVLGAGVNGSAPSLSMVNRLEAALDYLETYPDAVAIVSGGQGAGEDVTEASAMHDWLVAHGMPESRIVQEDQSTSTRENLENSFAIIRSRGGDPAGGVAVVSSEYHLYRAKQMARALGAKPLGVAAETTLPTMRANYFIREAFAAAYMQVFGVLY
ncbi:MAG: YdcF family protein [Clostridiales bacterium]|nr:YdcF family protein [Clostridiales bacterium]MDD6936602.1 YdcF family protein [Clostridiales bacterium]MDY2962144.1 YdcF family protein [Oscillospiraceae bacterium]